MPKLGLQDLLIIGGGINGVGIARDAAGRGLAVTLCEQGDLGGATSSASSKLIHGGLRYLEQFEFRLVREALGEREVLLAMAPHVVRPQRFYLPHVAHLRPAWFIRLGLFFYDHLARRTSLPGCQSIDLTKHEVGDPLRSSLVKGFAYSDCRVDDSRLVVLNAVSAAEQGAEILVRTRCAEVFAEGGFWRARLLDEDGVERLVEARVLINATGPWAGGFLRHTLGLENAKPLRLVKGSHIVVAKLFDHAGAYIFQHEDGRVIFAIPFEDDFTLIGTTDSDYRGDPAEARASAEEIDYLCRALGDYLGSGIHPADVVWSFAGVRPLYGDGDAASLSRDYRLELEAQQFEAPLLSVIGGKITTYRRLAEEVLELLKPHIAMDRTAWTAGQPLPGGDLGATGLEGLCKRLRQGYPWLDEALANRLSRAYGSRAELVLEDARDIADLGQDFGAGLYEREVAYLMAHEWARTADDVLWRRSKLGLRLTQDQCQRLADWMAGGGVAA
ncbi:MAG TPA: glycerol-3-phosphate dehydrogenase [Alphaproteobacteria bacterium]|jgi:glycerol-3-phosphate dehydrogenase|nr:glycerol-3-phosphate dehydrogenase [Alphaproteobacteria bacterium]MDP7428435.1 glycerol-3-phosphate dehydrogenase [Alphaproteobacteria bacterium]HJP20994.1 glycerol-3-phosphate dehydrogenase [Alphaproteobacteria bacterium]